MPPHLALMGVGDPNFVSCVYLAIYLLNNCNLFCHLKQTEIIWEGRFSIGKMSAVVWSLVKPLRHILYYWMVAKDPGHCGLISLWLGGPDVFKKTELALVSKPVGVFLLNCFSISSSSSCFDLLPWLFSVLEGDLRIVSWNKLFPTLL